MLKDLAGARNEPHAIASDDATFFERSTPIRKSSALRRYFARFQPHQLKQVNGEGRSRVGGTAEYGTPSFILVLTKG